MFALKRQLMLTIRNKQTYIRILVYFAIISVGAMTLSNVILYSFFTRVTLNEIGNHTNKQLVQKAQSMAFMMNWTVSSVLRFSHAQNMNIYQFAMQAADDPLLTYRAWNDMKEIKNNNPFFESVYIYNDFTKQIANTYNGTADRKRFADSAVFAVIDDWGQSDSIKIVPRKFAAAPDGSIAPAGVISIVVKYEKNGAASAFIVNLNADKLQQYLGQAAEASANEVYLLNSRHQIMAHSDQSRFMQPISADAALNDKINEVDSGWIRYKFNGVDSIVVIANSAFQDWKLVQIIPEHEIFEGVEEIQNAFYIIYAVIFLLILLMVWRVSKNIYSPIEGLLLDVRKKYGQQMNENLPAQAGEVSLLSRIFNWQNTTINQLHASTRKNKQLSKAAFLKELLLEPTYSIRTAASLFAEHEIRLSPTSMAIVLFRIDRFDAFTRANTAFDQKLLRYALTNIAMETWHEHASIETIDMGRDHIVVLCNIESEEELAHLADVALKCQANMQTFLSVSTTAAIGPFIEQYDELPTIYKETYELTNERIHRGPGKLIMKETDNAGSAPSYAFPEKLEKKILDALKLGHGEDAQLCLDEFVAFIRSFSYSHTMLALLQLIMNLGKTLRQMHVQNDDLYSWTLSDIEQRLNELETIDAIGLWLQAIIAQTMASLAAGKDTKNKQHIDEIKEIVSLQLNDPNLSSKLIADRLSMSVNYVRTLFKDETGVALSEYIKDRRLDKVQELLIQTDSLVEDICMQTGFSSIHSFYPIFKKKTGVTPAQFRKDHAK